ncbi:hypothetical protein BDZ94DRAFT_1312529 [Collybia nuda]|uniref:Uncharacterized protein n=1 Tax=Collybia nuda TaxID=64659 RepID=A0A9P6CFQ6_9AGAR|nr:hypothetical protein BDZ94DRAFT_1312529 [Collybia nuda]
MASSVAQLTREQALLKVESWEVNNPSYEEKKEVIDALRAAFAEDNLKKSFGDKIKAVATTAVKIDPGLAGNMMCQPFLHRHYMSIHQPFQSRGPVDVSTFLSKESASPITRHETACIDSVRLGTPIDHTPDRYPLNAPSVRLSSISSLKRLASLRVHRH